MGEQIKTIGFATLICLVCSLLLAGVYSSLREEQEQNARDALKATVLDAFGVELRDEKGKALMNKEQIATMFEAQIKGKVLDKDAKLTDVEVADLDGAQINERDKVTGLKEYYPFYVFTYAEGDETKTKYAIHVSGMGLWSVVKGYLALTDDLSTIAGIAFYDHAETPGLGGEIDREDFRDDFVGKRLMDKGEVKQFMIVKKGTELDDHSVDGISGATMTCNGVTELINADFVVYAKYFKTIRENK